MLTGADDYTVTFFRYDSRTLKLTPIENVEHVGCEQLRETFTKHTGLDVSL